MKLIRLRVLQDFRVRGIRFGMKTAQHLALKDGVPEDVKRVLTLRGEAARTSDSKLQAIRNTMSVDSRLRHLFNFYGASRAGRWTSHGVQFQNLPKPLFQDKDGSRLKLARELVRSGDYEAVRKEFGDVESLPWVPSSQKVLGSTWGASMLETHYIGRGMSLEFRHPKYSAPIVTSPIQEIEECPALSPSEIAQSLAV